MRRLIPAVVLAVLLATACAFGALSDAQKQAVKALIGQFSAKPFDVRQHAVDRLIEIGPDVLPIVKKTLAEATYNEVKLRCQMVIDGIEKRYGVKADEATEEKAAPAQSITLKDLAVSRITLDGKKHPLADVFAMIAEQSGNAPIGVPGNLADKPITAGGNGDYWRMVDSLCKVAGAVYQVRRQRGGAGLVLVEGEATGPANAYAGPAVITLDRAVKSASYRKTRGGPQQMIWVGPMMPGRDGLQYTFTYYWEDRLPVLHTQCEFTRAIGPGGADLLPKEDDAHRGPAQQLYQAIRYGGPASASGTASLTLPTVPQDAKEISEVSGVLTMLFGIGQRELKIDDGENAEGKTATSGPLKMEVRKVDVQQGMITVQVALTENDKPVDAVQDSSDNYGFFLVDSQGERHRGNLMNAGRVITFVGGQRANVRIGPDGPDDHTFRVMFGRMRIAPGKWTLVYVHPKQLEKREYPFALKNVPIP